jgi:hypothetical protein
MGISTSLGIPQSSSFVSNTDAMTYSYSNRVPSPLKDIVNNQSNSVIFSSGHHSQQLGSNIMGGMNVMSTGVNIGGVNQFQGQGQSLSSGGKPSISMMTTG